MKISQITNRNQNFGMPWKADQRDTIPQLISLTCPRDEIIDAFEKFMWLDCDLFTPNHEIFVGSLNKKNNKKDAPLNITLIARPLRNGVQWEYEHLDPTGEKSLKTSLDILAHEIQANNRQYFRDPEYYNSLPPEYAIEKLKERMKVDEDFKNISIDLKKEG